MIQRLVVFCIVAGAVTGQTFAESGALVDSSRILEALSESETVGNVSTQSEPVSLLQAVREFATPNDNRSSEETARQWLGLLIQSVGKSTRTMPTVDTFDLNTMSSVSAASLIAALPEPRHWAAIAELIESGDQIGLLPRSQQSAIRLIGQALQGDAKIQYSIATQMEQSLKGDGDFDDTLNQAMVNKLLTRLAVASGDKDSTIASIRKQYRHGGEYPVEVELPDLVTLYGESVARDLLNEGLQSPRVTLDIDKGAATIALAQDIALSEIETLKEPQWSLVRNLDAVELYEAMDNRFDSGVSHDSYARRQAQLVYLFGLVARGESAKASSVAERMKSDYGWRISQDLLLKLDKAGYTQQVADFLQDFLKDRADTQLWEAYIRLASATNHEEESLELVEAAIEGAPDEATREKLSEHRLKILLSIDRVPEALKILRARVADVTTEQRLESAVRLAQISELTNATQDFKEAVAVALVEAAKRIEKTGEGGYGHDLAPVFDLISLLRETGAGREAQNLAFKIVKQQKPVDGSAGSFSMFSGDFQKAGIELVGLYADAEQYEELMRFVNDYPYWGSHDLAGLLNLKDSGDDYVSFLVAKALARTGSATKAVRILEALILSVGGYDPAYQLYTEILGPAALPFLVKRSQFDRFQERPILWSAIVHYQQGEFENAKETIQKAIAIDPSDGEQGPGHRMRAYAVLADVMFALNEPKEAQKYLDAVAAIRLSEQADRFRKLDMHAQAVALYREAVDQFEYAYCVQSRLAISLSRRGQHDLAAEHYRRAYELMPSSFGRVESHCFGCERVFANNKAQNIADTVFTEMIAATPDNPQVHYMLAYLRTEQGRFNDAIALVRKAIALDAEYLNAWKLLFKIGEQIQLPSWEHDIAAIRMLELDPLERHVQVDRSSITDLKALWKASAVAMQWADNLPTVVYPLGATRRFQDRRMQALPEDLQFMLKIQRQMLSRRSINTPGFTLLHNEAIRAALSTLGATHLRDEY